MAPADAHPPALPRPARGRAAGLAAALGVAGALATIWVLGTPPDVSTRPAEVTPRAAAAVEALRFTPPRDLPAVAGTAYSWAEGPILAGVTGGSPPYFLHHAHSTDGRARLVEVGGAERLEFAPDRAGPARVTVTVMDSRGRRATGEIALTAAPPLHLPAGSRLSVPPRGATRLPVARILGRVQGGAGARRMISVAARDGAAWIAAGPAGPEIRYHPPPGARPGARDRLDVEIRDALGSRLDDAVTLRLQGLQARLDPAG